MAQRRKGLLHAEAGAQRVMLQWLDLDDLDGLEIEEDAGVVVGSETESIPLSEILASRLAMGR